MTVSEAIAKAKADGYKRLWLTNDFTFLRADVALDEIDDPPTNGLGVYMIREYSDVKVDRQLANPYIEKTLMLSVKDDKKLSAQARAKCLADAAERREAAKGGRK